MTCCKLLITQFIILSSFISCNISTKRNFTLVIQESFHIKKDKTNVLWCTLLTLCSKKAISCMCVCVPLWMYAFKHIWCVFIYFSYYTSWPMRAFSSWLSFPIGAHLYPLLASLLTTLIGSLKLNLYIIFSTSEMNWYPK